MLLVFLPLLLLLRLLLLLLHAEAQNGAVGAEGQSTGAQKGAAGAKKQKGAAGAEHSWLHTSWLRAQRREHKLVAGAEGQSAAVETAKVAAGAEEQAWGLSYYHDYHDGERVLSLLWRHHGSST